MSLKDKVLTEYKKALFSRCDDTGCIYYFSPSDFFGLKAEPIELTAAAGHTLKGYLYSYDGVRFDDRIIIFEHGMGGGHRAYMMEIERLARHGYLVLGYDHTGCMESGGASTNGFAQSLSDLDLVVRQIKESPVLGGRKISVMGHSWGAFSAMNICAIHPEIDHVVALSGFISVEAMVKQNLGGLLSSARKAVLRLEKDASPDYFGYNAIKSLEGSRVKALLIYSDNDKTVKPKLHYAPLKKALEGKSNIQFMLEHNKGHNPNYTTEAVKYLGEFFKTLNKMKKKGSLGSAQSRSFLMSAYDWNKMCEQDELVWEKILGFLDN